MLKIPAQHILHGLDEVEDGRGFFVRSNSCAGSGHGHRYDRIVRLTTRLAYVPDEKFQPFADPPALLLPRKGELLLLALTRCDIRERVGIQDRFAER